MHLPASHSPPQLQPKITSPRIVNAQLPIYKAKTRETWTKLFYPHSTPIKQSAKSKHVRRRQKLFYSHSSTNNQSVKIKNMGDSSNQLHDFYILNYTTTTFLPSTFLINNFSYKQLHDFYILKLQTIESSDFNMKSSIQSKIILIPTLLHQKFIIRIMS